MLNVYSKTLVKLNTTIKCKSKIVVGSSAVANKPIKIKQQASDFDIKQKRSCTIKIKTSTKFTVCYCTKAALRRIIVTSSKLLACHSKLATPTLHINGATKLQVTTNTLLALPQVTASSRPTVKLGYARVIVLGGVRSISKSAVKIKHNTVKTIFFSINSKTKVTINNPRMKQFYIKAKSGTQILIRRFSRKYRG